MLDPAATFALAERVADACRVSTTTTRLSDEKAELAEQRAEFHALADQRYAQFLETGESIPWDEARAWLMQRMKGKRAKRPAARKQAR